MLLDRVSVRYGSRLALRDASASAPAGSLICLVGRNGSGKSSLLKALAGSVPATGTMSVLGRSGPDRRSELTYVPQREAVDWNFPISVLEVVMLGRPQNLHHVGWLGRTARGEALEELRSLGMADLGDRSLSALSGGQQQRVMLARAIHSGRRVLLLDEPLNGVDPTTREQVHSLLRRHCDLGGTVLMATHDLPESVAIADRIWGLNGTVVADLAPSELMTEPSLRLIYGENLLLLAGGRLAIGDEA